jgi:PIN domain nuclease of toxin-antitoxin system
MLNLDTHILIRAFTGELRPREASLLRARRWGISGIVLWELVKLAQTGRIEVDLDDPEMVQALSGAHTWPITLDIARAIERLDFKSDPADEIIAATSLVHRVPLLTRDPRILASKVVPLAR